MAQSFVLGFGGSGARCVEALTYLCATGLMETPMEILLIDPDASNGNVSLVQNQLIRYQHLQATYDRDLDHPRYFRAALNSGAGESSFVWSLPAPDQAFRTSIQLAQFQEEQQELLHLLYDDSDLSLSFEKGYVGRAHIGSLDQFRTLLLSLRRVAADGEEEAIEATGDSFVQFFRKLRSAAQTGDARLMVIGSLFGGTGASALPAIPPLVSSALPRVADSIRMGCVLLAPYFSFPAGGQDDPDSALHPLATKAALYHYARNEIGYVDHYLIGAPDRRETNEINRPGGSEQRNDAHYVELAAALAGMHFFDREPSPPGEKNVWACGASEVQWQNFPSKDHGHLRRAFTSLATAACLHSEFLGPDLVARKHDGTTWARAIAKQGSALAGGELELIKLTEFSQRFLRWCKQVDESAGGQLLSVLGSDASAATLETIGEAGASEGEAYHLIIKALNRVDPAPFHNSTARYMTVLKSAVEEFCASHYSTWWG